MQLMKLLFRQNWLLRFKSILQFFLFFIESKQPFRFLEKSTSHLINNKRQKQIIDSYHNDQVKVYFVCEDLYAICIVLQQISSQFNNQIIVKMEETFKSKTLPLQYNPAEIFRTDLTPQEVIALTTMLPKGYSFHVDQRKKDQKPQNKKKTPDQILISSAAENTFRPKPVVSSQSSQQPIIKKQPKQQIINQSVKPCIKILQMLQSHKCALPFMEPVDVDGLNIPEYREIVKQPMDLTTIQSKLNGGKYQNPSQFHTDVIKIFNNSYIFNGANEDFIKITSEFQRYYYRISGETKPPIDKAIIKAPLQPSKSQKKKKKPNIGSRDMNDSQPMTLEQKKQLAFNIHRLAKEHIKGVRSIVFDNNSDQNQFDLEQLSQKKLRELQKYIRNKINDMENNLRSNIAEKTEQQNLDELQSDITDQFIDEPLGMEQE